MLVALPAAEQVSIHEVRLTARVLCKHEGVISLKLFLIAGLMLYDVPGAGDEAAGKHPSGSSPPSEWTASKPPMGPRRNSGGSSNRLACASVHVAACTSPSGVDSGAAIPGTARCCTLGELGSEMLTPLL